ncbi:beta strand repeat-containing protein, partial [Helicobacter sp. 'CLO3_human']|uniref:beta strand repeat-containing protein n=1 Tax=Helicobacter sp. 'CLO3_human' TaxID=2020249 RepID=UPI0013154C5F
MQSHIGFKKSLIAYSLSIILYPHLIYSADSITNTNESDKQVIIGQGTEDKPNPNEVLNGFINTSGNGNNTTVTFIKNSSMANGSISVAGGSNTIKLQDNSYLNITSAIRANSGSNTILDERTTASNKSTISGGIMAQNGGRNNLQNLKNFSISGTINSDGNSSSNIISLQNNSGISGAISANNGGSNTITLSADSIINITSTTTESASIFASGSNASNNINSSGNGIISGSIIAKEGGSNNITLESLKMGGEINANKGNNTLLVNTLTFSGNKKDITASNGGKNTLQIKASGDLNNIIAKDSSSTNTITLDGNAKILGYLSASEGGSNTITLNGNAGFNSSTTTQDNVSIYASGNNSSNTITGETSNGGSISGSVVASNSATNTITLNSLNIGGDVKANGGTNTITLNNGSLKNILADATDSTNTITLGSNISTFGYISASNGGNNNITINSSGFTSTATTTDSASIYANGSNSINTINGSGSGNISGAIIATNGGVNNITLSSLNIGGDVKASGGTNTITLNNGSLKN